MGKEYFVELIESIEPEGFELNQRRPRSRKTLRLATHDSLASYGKLAHELRALEHRNMLLHRGERHAVAGGKR